MAKNSCQKKPNFLEILGTKVVQFWCYTKLIKNKKVAPKLMLKINFENQILALFDVYFWPFNKSHEKINIIFVISAIIASIWNVFIKFGWHDEKLTKVAMIVLWFLVPLRLLTVLWSHQKYVDQRWVSSLPQELLLLLYAVS